MKKYIFAAVTLIVLILAPGCSDDEYSLNSSVFIEDPGNPGLPQYSEWGYNTFGAYVDRATFTSNNKDLPGKIIIYNDEQVFNLQLKGVMGYYTKTLEFSFSGSEFVIADYPDLIALKGKTIDLSAANCTVTFVSESGTREEYKISTGEFVFNHVQNLYVDLDTSPSKTIISGHFNFKTGPVDPISVYGGRFDLGIGYDNFFWFQNSQP